MIGWFWIALLSLLAYAIKKILYKIAVHQNGHTIIITQFMMLTTAVVSLIVLFVKGTTWILWPVIFIAVPYGLLYSLGTHWELYSLKKINALISYPVIRFNNILPIFFGLLFLGEKLTFNNYLGLLFVFISIFLLQGDLDE